MTSTDGPALEKPALYRLAEDGQSLRLLAVRCRECTATSFPATVHGCRRCGADTSALEAVELGGAGILKNFVTLHRDVMAGFPPPAIIGEVEIAPGVVEEVHLLETDEALLARGAIVQAVPVEIGRDGARQLACRFTMAGAGQ